MKIFRYIVSVLLIIPLAMIFFWVILDPGTSYGVEKWNREMLWLLIGLPILMVNFYAWIKPHIIEEFVAIVKKDFSRKADQ